MIQNPSADFVPAADTMEFAAKGDLPEKLKNASPESIARFREALSGKRDEETPGGSGSLSDEGGDPAETASPYGRQRSGAMSSAESRYDYAPNRGSYQGDGSAWRDPFSGSSGTGRQDSFINPGGNSFAPAGENRLNGQDFPVSPAAGSLTPAGETAGGQADMTSKISDSAGRESRYGFAGNQAEGARAPDGAARAEGRGEMFRETQSFRSFAGSFPDYSRGEAPRRQVSELSDIFSAAFAGRTDAPAPQGSGAMEAAPAPAAPPSDAAAREEIMKIADTLVEKILVSDPQSTAGNQVMIKMSAQSQLSGTEILLTRSNDGTLAVVINSANDNQYRKLNEARERLEASLKKLERGSFTVTVNPPETQES
ncbi:MAG: hypothetical protein II922_06100 [Succinimonas sp.]|nr:hypothetical protein [Succinimonas sp.]